MAAKTVGEVYAGAFCVTEKMEEEIDVEKSLGGRVGGGGMQPVQDEEPQVHNPIYTGQETPQEPFFRVHVSKQGGQARGNGRFPFQVPAVPADMCQEKFSESMDESCSSPTSVTTCENLNVEVRLPDLARCQIVPHQSTVYEHYLPESVVPGGDNAVTSLLDDMKDLSLGTHGVITDTETCQTPDLRYEEQEHFIVNRNLGKGMSGTADLCTDKISGEVFVRKKLLNVESFPRREVDVLKGLKHRNIAQFKGFVMRGGQPEIYLEYAGLTLNKLVSDPGRCEQLVTARNVAHLAQQGLEALHFLDMRGILHLDVKPDNVCVIDTPHLVLKLTDFGSCKPPEDPLQFRGWTPEYMSPEACSNYVNHLRNPKGLPLYALTGKTDVYAFGATIAFMRYRVNPLTAYFLQNKTREQYMNEERINIILHMHMCPEFMNDLAQQIPSLTPNERLLLAKLLAGDKNDRYSAKEALIFIQEVMLPELTPQIQPARLQLQPPAICDEAMSPQPASPASCQPTEEEEELLEDELEIDVRAKKQRGPIQTTTPEATCCWDGDPMSQLVGRTGQAVVFEDRLTAPFSNSAVSVIFVSGSTESKNKSAAVTDRSSTIPTMVAPIGNFGMTVCNNQVPAGNTSATFRHTVVSGKSSGMSGKGTMAQRPPQQQQQQSLGKIMPRRHLPQRQKAHPYLSENKFGVSSNLPDLNELI